MRLHIFNPENDLALADGKSNYCPPPAACAIARDLATLPLWYAEAGDCVLLPDESHLEYYESMSASFSLARPLSAGDVSLVDACLPWGWSAQMRRRFLDVGVSEFVLPDGGFVEGVRSLSNRRSAIALLRALRDAGVDTPDVPLYLDSMDDVTAFVESMPRSVIKAPWSGSGKGVMWGIGRMEVPVENFCKGVLRRQGGVVCECFLDKAVDFAMEFFASGEVVSFAGYSLFKCAGGAYSGNILASDAAIEGFLASFVGRDALAAVKGVLVGELGAVLRDVGYTGFLGVDMLVYRSGDGYRLHPCVELNLRMNMGAVSRLFYDRFVACGRVGRFFVSNFRCEGEALALHERYKSVAPLCVHEGRVLSGYLNLSPVTAGSGYLAYVLVEKGEKGLASLYACE